MPAYFNVDDHVTRNLGEAKTSARRAKYTVTVANAFFASIAHEAQKEVVEALKAGDIKNALCHLKQVSNNLGTTMDLLSDQMVFLKHQRRPGSHVEAKVVRK
jgi:hypothetical protein